MRKTECPCSQTKAQHNHHMVVKTHVLYYYKSRLSTTNISLEHLKIVCVVSKISTSVLNKYHVGFHTETLFC